MDCSCVLVERFWTVTIQSSGHALNATQKTRSKGNSHGTFTESTGSSSKLRAGRITLEQQEVR
jgi:hypothetical protein